MGATRQKNQERVSNLIRFIEEKHIRLNQKRGYQKSVSKEERIVADKTVKSRFNYYPVKTREFI